MTKPVGNSRLETFCDGIYAIAITLLIIEIKAPEIGSIHSAQELKHDLLLQWPSWFAFLLTFLTLFISWVNHHHMIALLNKTSNTFIYANGFLMLTVVIFPFSTMLLGRYLNTEFSTLPIVLYCFNTFLHASAWVIVFKSAYKTKDLSKDEESKTKLVTTTKVVTYSGIFNFCLTL